MQAVVMEDRTLRMPGSAGRCPRHFDFTKRDRHITRLLLAYYFVAV
jgi:hypothetical protein